MTQWGVNYWETYSPVVNWMSVCLMMTMSILFKLDTRSIDFVLAFPQDPLGIEIFARLPQGFAPLDGEDRHYTVLLIKKNLYGLKDAGLKWFEFLKKGLEEDKRGFKQSQVDPCVFFKKGIMILVYVDDCLIFSKDQKLTEETYQCLKKDFDLNDEGSIDKYLGIDIKRQKNGTIHLTQPSLHNQIVESMPGISNSNPKYTPAIAKELLHKDVEGQVRKNNWNYRSVVGMLNYLASSTRPDIQFAVHQCACFCNDPKLSHEQACKHICKYIRITATEGLIY